MSATACKKMPPAQSTYIVNTTAPPPGTSAPVNAALEGPGTCGAEDLYSRIAADFGPALGRLARGYESDHALRQDLLQDIHVALWRSLSAYDGRCSIRTWVYQVAHNAALTHVTRNRRLRLRSLSTLEDWKNLPDSYNAEELTDRGQVVERLSRLIGLLHPLDRQIVLLYLEDLDGASIAAVTGLTPGNVATKIHRIKALFARSFHSEGVRHE